LIQPHLSPVIYYGDIADLQCPGGKYIALHLADFIKADLCFADSYNGDDWQTALKLFYDLQTVTKVMIGRLQYSCSMIGTVLTVLKLLYD
jgi:hypothetical protein